MTREDEKSTAPTEHQDLLRPEFYQHIAGVLRTARSSAYRAINSIMVEAYWKIGRMIVEEEQQGQKRAEYGRYLLRELSARLRREFGNSFSERNLRNFRQFYLCFPIWNSVRSELTWTHYRALMRVEDSDAHPFREADLEQAIIDKIQAFLLELGKGFAFVARQKRISTETKDFYIDLVFYNYILKCFVLVDLKTQELTHQDIGQMDMYVRLYEDKVKVPEDNPTVGIILCTEKDQTVVKYSVLEESQHLFAAKYQMVLPTEEELRLELERERDLCVKERQACYGVFNHANREMII